jgi:acetolactate synthase-1/2/3 large subunit
MSEGYRKSDQIFSRKPILNSQLDCIASEIAQSSTEYVFGIPGGGVSLELIDKLSNQGVRFLTTHSEASAAIIAGTIGHLSGTAGISMSIKGPGLTSMLPGIAVCFFEQFPLVALSESYSPDSPLISMHKRLNHQNLVSEISKKSTFLSPNNCNYKKLSAFAEEEVPGPVLLNLIEGNNAGHKRGGSRRKLNQSKSQLTMLNTAKKPVVIAGALAVRLGWEDQLKRLEIPVFTTASAKGLVDESSKNSAGVFTGAGLELTPEFSLIPEADCVVGLGLRSTEVISVESFGKPSINVDYPYLNQSKGFGFSATANVDLAGEIFSLLEKKQWGCEELSKIKKLLRRTILGGAFLPGLVFEILKKTYGDSVRLVVDTGSFCTISEHIWDVSNPKYFLCSANSRYMGTSLPMGLGSAFFDRSVPTVCALGDGGIGMYLADIKLAVEERLPILVILFSDGGFGSIRSRASRDDLDQTSLIKRTPSWIRVMDSFGLETHEAKDEHSLLDGLSQWNWTKGPCYIETTFDSNLYQRMTHRLRN